MPRVFTSKNGEVRTFCVQCDSNILASIAIKRNGLCKECSGENACNRRETLEDIEKKYRNHPSDRLPAKGEICVVSDTKFAKRDALLFDRIHRPMDESDNEIPEQILFGVLELEKKLDYHELALIMVHGGPTENKTRKKNAAYEYGKMGYIVTPAYENEARFIQEFKEGQTFAYQGALNNLPVPSEETPWGNILEFRKDARATGKLRDLRLWLEHTFNAQSEQHATDIISQKIDDYQWAIKKHGLKTIIGSISSVFRVKNSVVAATAVAGAAFLSSPVYGMLLGGAVLVHQVGVKVAEHNLEAEDIKRGNNREIAMIYDAQRMFNKN